MTAYNPKYWTITLRAPGMSAEDAVQRVMGLTNAEAVVEQGDGYYYEAFQRALTAQKVQGAADAARRRKRDG